MKVITHLTSQLLPATTTILYKHYWEPQYEAHLAMCKLVLILACAVATMGDTEIPGIQFGDNMENKYVTEENGVAMFTAGIAKKLTFCAWVYPQWSRWRMYNSSYSPF